MAQACLDGASLPVEFDAILQECSDGLPFLVEELLAGAAGAGVVVREDRGWRVRPGLVRSGEADTRCSYDFVLTPGDHA